MPVNQSFLSLQKFYERRARRIVPALFVVLLLFILFAWAFLLPLDFNDFAKTLAGIASFSSNFVLWHTSDYFSIDNEVKPLLHTWSLSVEEQYYCLFPVAIAATWRFGVRRMSIAIAGVALISFCLGQWESKHAPVTAFFLLPSRAWELLVGALLAFYLVGPNGEISGFPSRGIAEAISLIGFALVSYGIFAYQPTTPFPGIYAVAPTLGTAFLIVGATPRTLVGRVLGSRPLVGLGVVSYSVYLYHQPIFAFSRNYLMDALNLKDTVALCFCALVLGWLSWRFVEQPFRDRKRVSNRNIWQITVGGTIAFFLFGVAGHYSHGFASRLSESQAAVYSYALYDQAKPFREGKCFLKEPERHFEDFAPECGQLSSASTSAIIWGDSHAAAFSSGYRDVRPNTGQYTASSCPPLLGIYFENRPNCRETNEFVLAQIGRLRPNELILTADWLDYSRHDRLDVLEATINAVHQLAPEVKILIIGPVPRWSPSLPAMMVKKGRTLTLQQRLNSSFLPELLAADSDLNEAAMRTGARFVSAMSQMCDASGCEVVTDYDGHPALIAWDQGHSTEAGAKLLSERVIAQEDLVDQRNGSGKHAEFFRPGR